MRTSDRLNRIFPSNPSSHNNLQCYVGSTSLHFVPHSRVRSRKCNRCLSRMRRTWRTSTHYSHEEVFLKRTKSSPRTTQRRLSPYKLRKQQCSRHRMSWSQRTYQKSQSYLQPSDSRLPRRPKVLLPSPQSSSTRPPKR